MGDSFYCLVCRAYQYESYLAFMRDWGAVPGAYAAWKVAKETK